jgi:hypothetical protein
LCVCAKQSAIFVTSCFVAFFREFLSKGISKALDFFLLRVETLLQKIGGGSQTDFFYMAIAACYYIVLKIFQKVGG